MFQNLEIFQMSYAMARHAGQRQSISAKNMANADTPRYQALDITPFSDTLRPDTANAVQRATRASHLNGEIANSTGIQAPEVIEDPNGQSDPNGNSVSLESEIMRSVDAKRQHDRALAIYRSSLNILRTSLGRQ